MLDVSGCWVGGLAFARDACFADEYGGAMGRRGSRQLGRATRDSLEVAFAEDNHVVNALAADGPNEALDVWRLPRGAWCNRGLVDGELMAQGNHFELKRHPRMEGGLEPATEEEQKGTHGGLAKGASPLILSTVLSVRNCLG